MLKGQAVTSYECCKQAAGRFLKMLLPAWERVWNPRGLLDLPGTSVGESQPQTVWSGSVWNAKVRLKTSDDTFFFSAPLNWLLISLTAVKEAPALKAGYGETPSERQEYFSVHPRFINISLNSAGTRASRAHFSWKKCCLSEADISQLELDLFLWNSKSKCSSWLLKCNFSDVHPSFMLVT